MEYSSGEKRPIVIQWLLVAGLALVTNLFVLQIERVSFSEPQFEDFCKVEQVEKALSSESECVGAGGQWVENAPSVKSGEPMPLGYCNEQFMCQKEYDSAREAFERNSFVVSLLAGVILLGLSTFLPVLSGIVGNGLSFGAILLFIVSSTAYWSYMDEWLRLLVLGVAFVSLIVIAVKKFGKQE